MADYLLTILILGVVISGIYALFSIGLSLLFGVMDIVNVAHGELFTFGGYLAFICVTQLTLQPVFAMAGLLVGSLILGVGIYLLSIKPLHNRLGKRPKASVYLVLTLGLSVLLQNIMLAIAGGDYYVVPKPIDGSFNVLGSVYVSNYRLWIFFISMLVVFGLFTFLKYSKTGLAIRAVKENSGAAQAVGIRIDRIYLITFGLVGMMAGLAGALLTPIFRVYPSVGGILTIKAFAIVVMGGMGNLLGALIASFIVGISESFAATFIGSEWKEWITFSLMIIVLLIRPSGIIKGD